MYGMDFNKGNWKILIIPAYFIGTFVCPILCDGHENHSTDGSTSEVDLHMSFHGVSSVHHMTSHPTHHSTEGSVEMSGTEGNVNHSQVMPSHMDSSGSWMRTHHEMNTNYTHGSAHHTQMLHSSLDADDSMYAHMSYDTRHSTMTPKLHHASHHTLHSTMTSWLHHASHDTLHSTMTSRLHHASHDTLHSTMTSRLHPHDTLHSTMTSWLHHSNETTSHAHINMMSSWMSGYSNMSITADMHHGDHSSHETVMLHTSSGIHNDTFHPTTASSVDMVSSMPAPTPKAGLSCYECVGSEATCGSKRSRSDKTMNCAANEYCYFTRKIDGDMVEYQRKCTASTVSACTRLMNMACRVINYAEMCDLCCLSELCNSMVASNSGEPSTPRISVRLIFLNALFVTFKLIRH